MKLYEVRYPFEVEGERGTSNVVYPTLADALADARQMYAMQVAEESRYPGNGVSSDRPATVSVVRVGKLDRAGVCEILNSGGDCWCEDTEPIGEICWDGKRTRFTKGHGAPREDS